MAELGILEPQGLTKADWEQVFRRATGDWDPWEFNILDLIDRFRNYLAAHRPEMAVPGRMVLASSVLLRLKSDWIGQGGTPPTVEEVAEEVAEEFVSSPPAYVAPEFRLPLRRAPRARVTVGDLSKALAAALAHSARRGGKPATLALGEIGLDFEEESFTQRALRFFRYLLTLVNGQRVIPFTAVAGALDPKGKVERLFELLHLDAQGKVRLFQQEQLGEVFIEVPHEGKGAC